jgi:hypothetical protein
MVDSATAPRTDRVREVTAGPRAEHARRQTGGLRVTELLRAARRTFRDVEHEYAHGEDRPLRGYLGVMSIYGGLTAAAVAAGRLRHATLPNRIGAGDLLLVGLATHKLSRMVTKDPVLSPFRAPVTSFDGQSGEAEVQESPRGHGFQHAAGELLTCPFCFGQWVATGLTAGLILAPRITRVVMTVATAKAISDTAQLVYDAAQKATMHVPA